MALDLGTLVAHLEVDATKTKKGVDEGVAQIDRFEKAGKAKAKNAGEKVGESLGKGVTEGVKGEESKIRAAGEDAGESFGDGVKSKIAALGIGAAVTAGFLEGMDLEASGDKLVASLGAQQKRGEKLNRIATDIYKGAWGDSVDEVNLALGSVVTSMGGMRKATEKELTKATTKALDFATAFDVDVARSVQVAGTLMSSGLAKNATEAFDLLTRGSQKVPVQLREDLQDAAEEYGQFFAGLGYDGEQAFAMLVDGAEKGIYGIDKVGDAVKEFTIRATDGSEQTVGALEAIGLDAEEMADKIVRGGDDAQDATRKIIEGLLAIKDPSNRANEAIALFGTPLEDLNVKDIPDFLRNMRGMSGAMDDFKGASKRMGDELNDNAKTRVTEFTRGLKTGFVEWFADEAIPFIEDEAIPALKGIGDALDDLPDWAVKGAAGGLLGALVLGKVGNVAGGIKNLIPGGGLGKAGKGGVVPVFVTNAGAIGAGGAAGAAGKGGILAAAGRVGGPVALAAAAAYAIYKMPEIWDFGARKLGDALGLEEKPKGPKSGAAGSPEHKAILKGWQGAEGGVNKYNESLERTRDNLLTVTNGITGEFASANEKARDKVLAVTNGLIDMGNKGKGAADRARGGVDDLASAIRNVPSEKTTYFRVDSSGARAQVEGFMNWLPTTHVVSIVANRRGNWSGSGPGIADGGTIGGDRFPYGDKVLAFVAPGEEVISNRYGQADRHRALLKAINGNQLADGGTVFVPGSHGASRGRASSGGGAVRVEFPNVIRLRVGDREFDAYVDDRADSRVAAHRSYGDLTGRRRHG